MWEQLNIYLYGKLTETASGSSYMDSDDVFKDYLPDYFDNSRNSIVYKTRQVDSYSALGYNNFLQVYEARVNVLGNNLDETSDILVDLIHTLSDAETDTFLDFEITLNTEFYNEEINVWEKVLIVNITTNTEKVVAAVGSFSMAYSKAFDT